MEEGGGEDGVQALKETWSCGEADGQGDGVP